MQRNFQKCSIAEAHQVSGDPHWKIKYMWMSWGCFLVLSLP